MILCLFVSFFSKSITASHKTMEKFENHTQCSSAKLCEMIAQLLVLGVFNLHLFLVHLLTDTIN